MHEGEVIPRVNPKIQEDAHMTRTLSFTDDVLHHERRIG